MLTTVLKNFNVILASGSPRRQHFFKELDLNFTVDVREVDEIYPEELQKHEITDYLANLKAEVFTDLKEKDLLITSDTIVWHNNKALGKPKDAQEAKEMLASYSSDTHQVITSVCFKTKHQKKIVHDTTNVSFTKLSQDEIEYYVNTYKPFDKAGGYGIQEWIGYIGITHLDGSYFNVMGLPTHLVYKTLIALANS